MIFIAFFVNDVFLNFSPMRTGFFPCLSLISDCKSGFCKIEKRTVFAPIAALVGHEEELDGILDNYCRLPC